MKKEDCKFQERNLVMIKVAYPSLETAKATAKFMVENHLASSARISRKNSFYIKEGEFCERDDYELSFSIEENSYTEIVAYIRNHHPDKRCQVIKFPVMSVLTKELE